MMFLLRATVVIGGLSYLALQRDRPDTAPSLPSASAGMPVQVTSQVTSQATSQALAAAWDAVPAEARDQIVREGMEGLVRRMGSSHSASADTLAAADRQAPWRGVASR